jgi:hypothetical protein
MKKTLTILMAIASLTIAPRVQAFMEGYGSDYAERYGLNYLQGCGWDHEHDTLYSCFFYWYRAYANGIL